MGGKGEKRRKDTSGDWLFLSITASATAGAFLWSLHGAGWGILSAFFTFFLCIAHRYNKIHR